MNENATKARIKSKTGIDCVIAWLEPCAEDDFHRKVKVSAVKIHPPVGSGFWDVAIELDDEKLGSMSIYREGITYTHKICRALACAVGNQALHAARNRRNRKARRDAECELKRKSEYFACIYPAFGNAEAAEYLAGKASEWNVPIESLKGKCSSEMMEAIIRHGPKGIRNLTVDRSLGEVISAAAVECLKDRLDKGGVSDEQKE